MVTINYYVMCYTSSSVQLQSKYGYSNEFIAQMINKDVEFINELLNPVESI